MTVVNLINQDNNIVDELKLPEGLFEQKVRPEIMNQVVKAHLAAKRAGTVGVKTRSLIRGGGKKPWRQKGTGRARAGSVRSPLWQGGAVIHGPKMRDYNLKVNKKVKKLAFKMALSSKLADGELLVINGLEVPSHKTKEFMAIKKKLNLKKSLIVVPKKDNNLSFSSRNIPGIKLLLPEQVTVYDILLYPQLVVTPEVIDNFQKRLQ